MSKKSKKNKAELNVESLSQSALNELEQFEATPIFREEEEQALIPEVEEKNIIEENLDESLELQESEDITAEMIEGSELDGFESADIETTEVVEEAHLQSILEGILFASDRPVSLASLKVVFKGTNIKSEQIRKVLQKMQIDYSSGERGVSLEEVPGGYKLRTKVENMAFLSRTIKQKSFRLSGPALEVLAIVAYKQPIIKSEIDEIRGVESGHLMRALMEKNLVQFEGKSDLPGKPMFYGTTKKFLEIFGLRNLKELPTLSQIDELLPEGIGDEADKEKTTLSQLTDGLSQTVGTTYSENEEELGKIADELSSISTSSEFFEQEKERQRLKRDAERAQNIREALTVGEEVSTRDRNWLLKYEQSLVHEGSANEGSADAMVPNEPSETSVGEESISASELPAEDGQESTLEIELEASVEAESQGTDVAEETR